VAIYYAFFFSTNKTSVTVEETLKSCNYCTQSLIWPWSLINWLN